MQQTTDAEAALLRLAEGHGVTPGHPDEVMAESERLLVEPGIDDAALEDLTSLPFVTIDNPDSRDLDQALHIERLGEGYRVRYALADAAWYVRPGSALFDEALRRGASYYLPGLSIPMLPPALSEGLVSLNPEVDRRALVFTLDLDGNGRHLATQMRRARIHSRAKLTYDGVQALYDAPGTSPLAGTSYAGSLALLSEVGRLRLEAGRRRNVVEYQRRTVAVGIGAAGHGFSITSDLRNDVERYNEQVSLLCNTAGARLLEAAAGRPYVQPIFRVHRPPGAEALDGLEARIRGLVRLHALASAEWEWRRPAEHLAGYLRRLPRAAGTERVRRAIERLAILSNVRSTYAGEPGGHYGIGARVYARFSAPMREVVGIFTHKEALEALAHGRPRTDSEGDAALRDEVVRAGNRSTQVQRQLTSGANALAIDALFRGELQLRDRPSHPGTVIGVRAGRAYVQLDDPPIELKLYQEDLEAATGCPWELRSGELELAPSRSGWQALRLGDGVRLAVASHDPRRRRWAFHVTGL